MIHLCIYTYETLSDLGGTPCTLCVAIRWHAIVVSLAFASWLLMSSRPWPGSTATSVAHLDVPFRTCIGCMLVNAPTFGRMRSEALVGGPNKVALCSDWPTISPRLPTFMSVRGC